MDGKTRGLALNLLLHFIVCEVIKEVPAIADEVQLAEQVLNDLFTNTPMARSICISRLSEIVSIIEKLLDSRGAPASLQGSH